MMHRWLWDCCFLNCERRIRVEQGLLLSAKTHPWSIYVNEGDLIVLLFHIDCFKLIFQKRDQNQRHVSHFRTWEGFVHANSEEQKFWAPFFWEFLNQKKQSICNETYALWHRMIQGFREIWSSQVADQELHRDPPNGKPSENCNI